MSPRSSDIRENRCDTNAAESFECLGCGACCRIKDGIVRVSAGEIARIASYLGIPEQDFIERETELAPDRAGLVLRSGSDGACVWLDETNRCRIHAVKPDKCRTFPLAWQNADSADVCPALARRAPRGARFPLAAGTK